MSYYASGNGSITFKRELSSEEIDALKKTVGEEFEYSIGDRNPYVKNDRNNDDYTVLTLWAYDNYHEDTVMEILDAIVEKYPVDTGSLEYIGEDYSMWRFLFRDDEWIEQSGHVAYDDD